MAQSTGHMALSESERRRILVDWNKTEHLVPELCIHECVEQQVRKSPSATAVVFGRDSLSFRELNFRANQLARHLREMGLGPDVLAAICMERSLEMVIGVLAVLKTGGAYVPLDPSYPAERLAFMLADSAPVVVLSHGPARSVLERAAAGLAAAPIVVDLGASQWKEQSDEDLDRRAVGLSSRNLAYVIYTSGSTGRPKGVMNEHGPVVNRLLWMRENHPIDEMDAVLQKTSFSFDVSVWEIFWPLISGARLVLAEPRGHKDPDYLAELIVQERITRAHFIPSMLSMFLEGKAASACGCLHDVFCSGEELPQSLAQRFAQRLSGTRLHNLYGPTEAAIEVTSWTWDPSHPAERSVPIGRPIWNARIYLLDENLEPVPIGAPGALYIGGRPVARGYLNQPDFAAERFIRNPFVEAERLYKTGDLARYMPDGAIVFIGRNDDQVKIRGFRVELGEIEARLASYPGIVSTAVVMREDQPGDKRLIAYFTADSTMRSEGFGPSVVRAYLAESLPDYMIPAALVQLPAMPLTPGGKLDRSALPAPSEKAYGGAAYEELVGERERILARVWSDVLGIDRIGRRQDFFTLGGDSILAIQVAYRAKREGLKVAPRQLFKFSTIAELAKHVEAIVRADERPPSSGEMPLLPIHRQFFDHDPKNLHYYHQSRLVRAPLGMDHVFLTEAFRALYSRHDALRLRFSCEEGRWRAHFAELDESVLREAITVEPFDDPAALEELVTRRCGEARCQINIVRGPIFRVVLFVGPRGSQPLFFMVFHHLVVDGVSWRILLDHLRVAHEQWLSNQRIDLGARTTSYQDWAKAVERLSASTAISEERPFWMNMFSTPVQSLSVDFASGRDLPQSSTRVRFLTLNETESTQLLTTCQDSYGARANELLLGALLIAFFRWQGIRRLRIGVEGHGREEDSVPSESGSILDLSQTMGWFTTYFPLELALPEGRTPSVVVEAVKRQCRSVPRKGLGYGTLRHLLADANLAAWESSFPIDLMFNYLGQIDNQPEKEASFSRVGIFTGEEIGSERRREYRIGFNGGVENGRLMMTLDYSAAEYDERTIDAIGTLYQQALREIIEYGARRRTDSSPQIALTGPDEAQREDGEVPCLPRSIYPVTEMQLGLIFYSQIDGSRGTYSNQICATFDASLNVVAFRAAWERVVERHEILRTAFVRMDLERPLQSVARQVELPWTEVDVSMEDGVDGHETFETRRLAHKMDSFELDRAPLMRFLLWREKGGRCRFSWTYHHCLLDGWSVSIIWSELARIYRGIAAGTDVQLPAPASFEKYVRWWHEQDGSTARVFWSGQLDGFRRPTRLINEQARITSPREHGPPVIRWSLSEDQTRALTEASRRHKVTVATVILGTWAALVQRYSRQEDVVFALTTSGRGIDLEGADSIVGLMINTIPVRVIGHELQEPGIWLRALQADQVEREANAYLSLSEIQRCGQLKPGEPLFDTLVIFQNYSVDRDTLSAIPSCAEIRFEEETHFGLTLLVVPGPTMAIEIGFDSSRFLAEDVSEMSHEFNAILETLSRVPQGVTAPAESGTAEPRQLSKMSRQGELRLGRYLVHQLIENNAQNSPEKIAVSCGGRELSYDEVNRTANRIANHISARFPEIASDTLVALVMPRNEDLLIAILAVWKLGAAYVPIDPKLPGGRVALMLQGAGVKLVIANRGSLESHPISDFGFSCETFEAMAEDSSRADSDLDVNVSGNDLAYVVYTSGSTGKPKGAMVEHIGVLNNIANKVADFEIGEGSRVAQTASQSFDISVWQMFIALTRGGTTVIYEDATINNVQRLWECVQEDRISVLEVVPSYFVLLMENLRAQQGESSPASLKFLVLTGESADAGFIAEWFDLFPATKVVNAYGPTEASDDITHHVMTAGERITNPVPVGRPLANFDIYVVDEELRPVPVGEKGEIVVTGVGVGRGYVNIPAGDDRAFTESPFPDKYRRRLYRTGDLGRIREDGLLVFLGRKDQQVKVRGFRIELEEIEAKLLENDSVRQCVVHVLGQSPQESYLRACVVPYGTPEKQALIDDLARKLPAYMIPGDIRFLSELPRLPNGKVDRAALQQLEAARGMRTPYRAPVVPIESRLARIWEEVLRTDRIGLDDDFFELGGDSFKAIRIAAKFGSPLEVADIYKARTIVATCAALASRGQRESRLSVLIEESEKSTLAVVGVSHSGGDPFSFFEVAKALREKGGNVAFYAVKLPRRPAEGSQDMVREVDQITTEVCDELAELQIPVILYAQCNGSALGISIAQRLERLERPALAFIVGGALFRTDFMPADGRSDVDVVDFLVSIGSVLPNDPTELAFFLSDFKYDCAMASAFYNCCIAQGEGLERITAPVFCIAGTSDPVIRDYQVQVSNWHRLSDRVTLVEYEGQGHYLLRDCPEMIAATIREVTDWLSAGTAQIAPVRAHTVADQAL